MIKFCDKINSIFVSDFNNVIKSSTDGNITFPSLNVYASLDNINVLTSTTFTFSWKNCNLNSCSDVTNAPDTTINGTSLRNRHSLKGFNRLQLPDLHKKWNDKIFSTDTNMTCDTSTGTQYCFLDSKILHCKNNYFHREESGTHYCQQTCGNTINKMPRYLYMKSTNTANSASTNTNTGYCNVDCHPSTNGILTCPSGNLDPDKYGTNLACNGATYTRFSFFCLANDVKYGGISTEPKAGALFYSKAFNNPTIEINVSSLTEYHLEVWYYPDKIYAKKINVTPTSGFIVFLTNSLLVLKGNLGYTDSAITSSTNADNYSLHLKNDDGTSTKMIPTDASFLTFSNFQWYKIQFSVIKNGSNWEIHWYYKNSSNAIYKKTGLTTSPSLSKITFCTQSCNNYYNSSNFAWYGGAYKLLRVWNTDFFDKTLYYELDK